MITREIKEELLQCAVEYPAVSILGPRQSGKTTLARQTFNNHVYISLEDPDVRRQAVDDPRGLLGSIANGAILDEIQRVPQLLSYLQGVIDADRLPGRFILTGSHQPELQQAISQSLAGRTEILELLPFTVKEVQHYNSHPQTPFEWIYRGFYPGLHENNLDANRFFCSYMGTYIERDLRAIIQLKDLSQFETFLRLLAGRVGQLINYTALANDVGVSSTTIKNWISILKASYILYELPPWFANIRKRLVKSPKLYFVDVGLAAWLLGLQEPQQVERDPLRGCLYENLIVMEVVKNFYNTGNQPQLYFFRDSHGNEVDLLISNAGRSFTAIEIKSSQTFSPEFVKGLKVFNQSVGNSHPVEKKVWFNGDTQTTYKEAAVSNPLKHGFNL